MRKSVANLASLTTIQVSNAALPLIIFPYVLSLVGPELYSRIVLSEALSLFLLTVVLYSFEVMGVAEVVRSNKTSTELSHIFSKILYTRISLYVIGLPFILAAAYLIDSDITLIVLCWSLVSLGYAIQPTWLFQGLEHNAPMAVIFILSRTAAVTTIFVTVHGPEEYLLVPLIIGGFYLAAGICAALYAAHRFNLRLVKFELEELKRNLRSGKDIFLGNISVLCYRDANVIILGIIGISPDAISSYSIAEKFTKALQAMTRPLNQLYFPRAIGLAQAANRSKKTVFFQLLKLTAPQLAVLASGLLVLIATWIYTDGQISQFLKIANSNQVIPLFAFMSIAPFFGVYNFMFGSAGLNAMGAQRYFLIALAISGVLSVCLTVLLVLQIGVLGAALGFVMAEIILMVLVTRKYFL